MTLVDDLSDDDAFLGHLLDSWNARAGKRRAQDGLKLIDVEVWHEPRLPGHPVTPHKSAVTFAVNEAPPPRSTTKHHDEESAMTKLEKTEIGVARAQAVLDQADRGVLELQDVLTRVQLGLDKADRLGRTAKTIRKVLLAALVAAGFGVIVMIGLKVWRSSTKDDQALESA